MDVLLSDHTMQELHCILKLHRDFSPYLTCGSGPLLRMARVLVPVGRLLMLILNVSLLVEYYTLKEIVII